VVEVVGCADGPGVEGAGVGKDGVADMMAAWDGLVSPLFLMEFWVVWKRWRKEME